LKSKWKRKLREVYRIANNALYFDDNHDYPAALWDVIRAIKPKKFKNDAIPKLKFLEEGKI
jgi:hypothetical protein